MWISLDGQGALYRQIDRALRTAILDGRLPAGSRLPPTRHLARELGVSRNVVLLAFDQLVAEGYAEGKVGSGTYVKSDLPDRALRVAEDRPPSAREEAVPLRLSRAARRVAELRPARERAGPERPLPYDFCYGEGFEDEAELKVWRRTVARTAAVASTRYAPAAGLPRLRAAIARHVRGSRGLRCKPEQVLVVSGSQQALDLCARVLLDPGDAVAIEDPHYQGARQVFLAAGARLQPIAVDEDGLDPAKLADLPASPRLVYVTPSHQFPLGGVMPLPRRLQLLQYAAQHGAMVLEDDYDGEYRYEGRPVEAVASLDEAGRSIYIGTFSKVLMPAMRLGFVIVRPDLVEAFEDAKWLADRHASVLEQEALATFLEDGDFDRHLRRTRARYSRRRDALIEALGTTLGERVQVQGTNAGMHLVLWLPELEPAQVPALCERAARRGVGVYPLDRYALSPLPRAGLLLGFASLAPEAVAEGVRRLAQAIDETLAESSEPERIDTGSR